MLLSGRYVEVCGHDQRYDEPWVAEAFIPAPLPDELDFAPATWRAVMQAQAAIARLDGAVSDIPNPMLLVRPLIRREAVSSSALEGTQTDYGELLSVEAEESTPSADAREVLNYVEAAEYGIAALEDLPVCRRLVNNAHELLLTGVRGDSHALGAPRATQVWLGARDGRVTDASFVPPPPGDVLREAYAAWEEWIHREDIPLLLRVALGHYQFETIHPYSDGNGRLGRLIVILQLIEGGLMSHHLMTISGFFEKDKANYISHLQAVREDGVADGWVAYFAEGLESSAKASLDRIRRARDLTASTVDQVRGAGVRGLAVQITEDLLGFPAITVPGVERRYDVSYPAANSAVSRLVDVGVLEQLNEGNYNRVFGSRRLLGVFR